MDLYHATPINNLASIQAEGLRPVNYWTSDTDLMSYYIETVEDEGVEAAVLVIDLDALLTHVRLAAMEPDHPGLDEPITTVLGQIEACIRADWKGSDKTWRDCLEIVHSVRCRDPVPAHALGVLEPLSDDVVPLVDFLKRLSGHRTGPRL